MDNFYVEDCIFYYDRDGCPTCIHVMLDDKFFRIHIREGYSCTWALFKNNNYYEYYLR